MPEENLVTQGYDAVYQALPRAEAFRRLWSEKACGLDYPAGYDHISFVTLDELTTVSGWLEVRAEAVLVDLACGTGGPGLWLARQTGTRLVGVDFSTFGLAWARKRAEQVGLAGSTTFVEGSFEATAWTPGLPMQLSASMRSSTRQTRQLSSERPPGCCVVVGGWSSRPSRLSPSGSRTCQSSVIIL